MSKVRVRFAPSPTGFPHLGNIRTALFNWLYAQNQKGEFILRFEDTDRERLVPESVDYIKKSLRWLGIDWQEGPDKGGPHEPYIQSQRLDIYRQRADILLKEAWLYPCWCSPERLDELRKKAQAAKKPYKYDRHCLNHPGDPGQPHVLRFKIDETYDPHWEDLVRSHLSQQGSELDDFVCIKSDGYPTYNFANVIDDHLMEISHVIRGDEFISSTPKFLQVYRAFNWQPPTFAHLPQVLGADKAKLSKRHGAEPVLTYQDRGYLPEAITNFLALLGWNDGSTKEFYSSQELVAAFSLERIQKSPAVFDKDRLDWFNGHYLRRLNAEQLLDLTKNFWPVEASSADEAFKKRILQILGERLKYLAELEPLSRWFFVWEPPTAKLLKKLADKFQLQTAGADLKTWLGEVKETTGHAEAKLADLEQSLKTLVANQGARAKPFWESLRVILSGGEAQTPPIWEIIYALGPAESTRRLERARQLL